MSPEAQTQTQTQIADAKSADVKCRRCSLNLTVDPGGVLEYESTVTYQLGSLVVKHPSSDRVVPGSNPGPVIFNTPHPLHARGPLPPPSLMTSLDKRAKGSALQNHKLHTLKRIYGVYALMNSCRWPDVNGRWSSPAKITSQGCAMVPFVAPRDERYNRFD